MGPRLTKYDLRIDPDMTLPDTLRLVPRCTLRSPYPDLRNTYGQNRVFLRFYIEFADRKEVSSKDWIRPPA